MTTALGVYKYSTECTSSVVFFKYYMGSNKYVNKNVNIAAQQVVHLNVFLDINLDNLTPNTINADEYFKM